MKILPSPIANMMASWSDEAVLRQEHTKLLLTEVAKVTRDVVLMVPGAFITGTLGGPILVSGALFAGSTWINIAPTLAVSTLIISAGCGLTAAILSVIPRIHAAVIDILNHLSWILDPLGCQAEEYQNQVQNAFYITGSIGLLASLAVGSWATSTGRLAPLLAGRLDKLDLS